MSGTMTATGAEAETGAAEDATTTATTAVDRRPRLEAETTTTTGAVVPLLVAGTRRLPLVADAVAEGAGRRSKDSERTTSAETAAGVQRLKTQSPSRSARGSSRRGM